MRVMEGALEGDLFLGPEAEVWICDCIVGIAKMLLFIKVLYCSL